MLKKILQGLLPNPFDVLIKNMKKKNHERILLCWNRGLGDIPLGLYAMVRRIKELHPLAKIYFLIRKDLEEGFSLLEGVEKVYIAKDWMRGNSSDIEQTLKDMHLENQFDLILTKPDPYAVVTWQYGKVQPKLQWNKNNDSLYQKFKLDKKFIYVGIQPITETSYNFFRNWSKERWEELFILTQKKYPQIKFILFGFQKNPLFSHPNLIDLRGETSLLEMLSIIKNICTKMVLGDSGVLAMTYYLAEEFPIHLITLWANPDQGILRQNVSSPNTKLIHSALYAQNRDLTTITAEEVYALLQRDLSC